MASPITDALRKTEPQTVEWDEAKKLPFQTLKDALTSGPVLRALDYTRPNVVQCDTGDRRIGAVLSQIDNQGNKLPVVFISQKLTAQEGAYTTSVKECSCFVSAVQKLSCYLAGSRFVIETDHCSLKWLQNMSPKNGRLLHWSLALQQYNFEVRYKKGKLNGNADGLSRSF